MMIKKNVIIFQLFMTVIILQGCFGAGSNGPLTDINAYDTYLSSVENSESFMPPINSFENFSSVEVYYYRVNSLFESRSINLIFTYSDENYDAAKVFIEQNYTYLQPKIDDENSLTITETQVLYYGYEITIVEDDSFKYPKWFGMIGYSDTSKQILFMFYYDKDRDVITSLYDFVENNFAFSENKPTD